MAWIGLTWLGLACPQASAKSGKERFSDDHDLQDIVAGSQVPLRGRRCHSGGGQQESEDFTLPEDAGLEEVSVPHGKRLTSHQRDPSSLGSDHHAWLPFPSQNIFHSGSDEFEVRYDLLDCHISICSPQVTFSSRVK